MTGLSQRKKGSATNELRFVYDGWNLIATLNSQLSTLKTFAWGLDLSGSQQGAGLPRHSEATAGCVLAVNFGRSTLNLQPSTPFPPSTSFVSFDGNGNVVALFNAANSSETARYEYGPFGEVVRTTGPACGINPFRFSTKYQDDETDLLYYGYRYYNASTGRWLSRDPIEETGGVGLYCFVLNQPVKCIDRLGLLTDEQMVYRGNCKSSVSLEFVPRVELGGKWFEWLNEPAGTEYMTSVDQAIDLLKTEFKDFDPKGRCCLGRCISELSISAHGGSGHIDFNFANDEVYSEGSVYKRYAITPIPPGYDSRYKKRVEGYLKTLAFLKLAASKMCSDSQVIFVVCDATAGDEGAGLKAELRAIFGPSVTVTTYDQKVGYSYRRPVRLK